MHIVALAAVLMQTLALGPQAQVPDRRVLWPLDYQGVRLLESPFKRQLDACKEYYLRIPNDDLLLGFRRRAGKPAPGKELGGWYSSDSFSVFGQILSGLARLYAATGDPACKWKAEALLKGWSECIAADGFFFYSNKPNAPHYVFDKMVGGLVDMAKYCKSQDAVPALLRVTDWAVKNLDRTNAFALNSWTGPTEWYTLSENLYRAYLWTGNAKFRDFAKVWENTRYWTLLGEGKNIFPSPPADGQRPTANDLPPSYHAYSHVNTLGGAAMAYRVTGEKHYLDTLTKAYDYLRANECYATGGYGPDEQLLPPGGIEGKLRTTPNSFETQCGTWAGFKLSKHLISITGQAQYGDWAEELLCNGIGATIPMSGDGRVLYYSDYNVYGGIKRNCPDGWSCCTGTRPMAVADIADQIYYKAPDGIYVNLFVPSTVTFYVGGKPCQIKQLSSSPEGRKVAIEVSTESDARFTLRVRKPDWARATVKAEKYTAPGSTRGSPVELNEDANGWLSVKVSGTRSRKDTYVLTFPWEFRSLPLEPKPHVPDFKNPKPPSAAGGEGFPAAINFGPLTLAFRSDSGNPANKIDWSNLPSNFVPVEGEELTWRLKNDPNVLVRPFYAIKEGEEYYVYLDPGATGRVPHRKLRFSGTWNGHDYSQFRWSNTPGASVEGEFEGRGVRLIAWRFDDAGRAEVRIDGEVAGVVDQFGPGRGLPFEWSHSGLKPGRHTLKLTILADKDERSKDRFINVGGIEAIPQAAVNPPAN